MTKRKPAKKKRMKPVVAWAVVSGNQLTMLHDTWADVWGEAIFSTRASAEKYRYKISAKIIKVKITQA